MNSLRSLKKIVLLAMFVLAFAFGAFAQSKDGKTSKDDKTSKNDNAATLSTEDMAPAAVQAPQEGPTALFDSASQNANWLSNSMLENLNLKPDAPDAVNNYAPTRATGITYNSISTTGTSPATFRNGTSTDDNLSDNLPIGFTFIYNGQAVQQFRMSTNGFLTFNTTSAATGGGGAAYGFQNTQFSVTGGTTNTLAPFYEDQQTAANLGTLADLQASLKYQTTGAVGSRVLTAEWINFQDFSSTSTASFNYQVKIYEADGHIEFVYGTMNQTGTTTVFSYTVGINAATISATPTAAELLTQQTANTNVFSSTPQNALATVPESNSMLTFTPPVIVPAAPTNLTFTNIRPGSVTLNWVDNATNETNYNILISSDGINFQTFGAVLPANTTGITITGLLPNTTYFFRVIATTEGFASTPLDGSVTTAPPISGTKTIGPGGDFTTFAAAITDVNGGTGAGGVIFNVTAGTTFTENTPCITVQGTAANPIIFQKLGAGANPIIQPPGSTSTVDAGVCILGGDFITFDGIDIVVAAGNTAVERGFDIENISATNGANNNTIRNTSITMNRASTNVSFGIVQLAGNTPTSAAGTNNNNKYQNFTIQNVGEGITLQGSTAFQDTGNEISTTAPNTFNTIGAATANDIGNFAGTIYGIQAVAQSGVRIANNEIRNITDTSTSSSVYGIFLNNTGSNTFSVGTNNINNNKIHDIQLTGASTTGVVYGIREELTANAASVSQVYNNFVYNLNTTSVATTTRKVIGIGAQIGGTGGGSTHNIDFNSVRIALTSLVTSSTAFETGTSTPVFRIRDNIFSNFTGAQTTGSHYAVVFSASALGAAGSVSNYNDLYVANTTGGFIGNTSGTNRTDLAAFRTATGQDANSISADPLFLSATDLHVSPTSPVVDAGTAIPYTNKDIDGQNRVGNPDIGADEPGGTTPPANDIAATAITNPPSGSIFAVGATVTPTATFTNVGSATQTNVSVSFTIAGPGGYFYTNTKTIASIAVDQTVTVTFDPTPAFTTAGIYNMTAAVATVDANSANDVQSGSFQVIAPLTGSVNVGTGEAFTSLTNPGGVFANLNGAGATGNVVINITSDLTAETGAIALNELAGGFTVTIKPSGAARIVSGSAATSLIRLNGADNVTIDGSLTGGTDKSLTISNTNTSGAVIHFLNAATADTVKNSILQGVSTSTVNGVVFFSTVASGTVGNSNDTIQNNDIRGGATAASNGIYNLGTSTAKNTNNVITQNRIFDFSAFGINDAGSSVNVLYSRNEIFEATAQTTTLVGFSPRSTSIDGFTFTQNYIHDLNSTGQITGISLFDTSTLQTSLMSNNMIALSVDTATIVRGIFHNTATGEKYNVYHNSIYIGGTTTGTNTSEAYYRSVADTTNLRNNIFVNARTTTGTGKQYAIRTVTTTSVFTSDFNDIFNTGGATSTTNIFGQVGTTDTADLAAFRTASGTDANSVSVDPLFVSTNNLHLQPTSPVINAGTPLASVPVDFDGQTRDAAPDIGADEIVAGTLALSSATYSVNENVTGGVVTITVNRTGGTDGAVTVPYTLTGGTATGGATCSGFPVDYVNTGGTVSFVAGQASKTFDVPICDDAVFEGNETFNVNLGTATGGATTGTPATAVVTIVDNDTAPTFAINSISQNEGDTGTTAYVFTVTKSGATSLTATVAYTTLDGTAMIADGDYQATSGTLTFLPADTAMTITVLVNGDKRVELNEAFNVQLSNAVNAGITTATGTGTIVNDDAAGVIVTPTTVAVTEGGATATYTVVLTSQPAANVTITITPDAQVTVNPTTLTFTPANFNVPQTVTVTAVDDAIAEPSPHTGTITQTATSGDPNYNGAPVTTVTANITDNDTAPGFGINDVTMNEGNAGTTSFVFTVTRSGATGAAATVNYTTVDGTATVADNDYALNSGMLSFAIGETTKPITVLVNGDTTIEPTETFTVLLSGASGATITDDTGLGTITNDDFDTTPPTVVITQAAGQIDPTTATTVNFTVTFSEPVTGFGAQPGDVIVSGTAFAAGNTPVVTVTGNGTTYNVAVSGYTQAGTVIINIPAGAAQDPAGNNNLASNPAQGDNTVTVFPGATTLYVDDDGMAGPGGCDTTVTGISNIQSAVNASASGNTIQVCPGTYAQNVTVDKPLTILGPNANIDPNTGTRVPEAILLTTVSNPVNNNCDFNTDSNIMTLTAANAVVRGFTFDGDNPALNSTFVFNGANIDAYSAVFQQNVNNPNADVSNNIVKNTSEFGIILGSNDNASARTNSTIARNRLDNIVGFCFGEAIRIGENAYANVTDNVVTRSFNAVTIENFNNTPTSRPASVINNNRVQAYGFAIYHNLHYSYTGNGFTISNNTINSYVQTLPPAFARSNNDKALGGGEQPNASAFDKFRGVMLESIIGQVPVTVSNNRILPDRSALIAAGYTRVDGIFITNTSTDSPNIAITGNQISNAFRGISHVAPAVPTLTCNAISGNDVGLYVGTDRQFGGTLSSSTNGINVSMNNFTFNTAFGLQNDSSFMVIAENNYWNSPSGPRSPANPNGTGDRVSPNVDFTPFATAPTCGPTASGVTLSGRVTTSTGQGIAKVKLTLTNSQGVAQTITSGRGGNFTFTDVTVGETYILTISSRNYQFAEPTRVITVNENISGINFIAN